MPRLMSALADGVAAADGRDGASACVIPGAELAARGRVGAAAGRSRDGGRRAPRHAHRASGFGPSG